MNNQSSYESLLEQIIAKRKPTTVKEIEECKKEVASQLKLQHLPTNVDLLKLLPNDDQLISLLKLKPVKTSSGIAVIAVMAEPHNCPHGTCVYCPGGVNWGTPQSYTGLEPASMRAQENEFDPFLQVQTRLNQLKTLGHEVGKCELIIIGGTFTGVNEDYQINFVKRCLDALNQKDSQNIDEAKIISESSKLKTVGLTVETKPDFCKQKDIDLMLSYGTTRVELGVQALSDESYRLTNRGHTVQDVVDSFKLAKDSGLKIVAHMMPGLPGLNYVEDLKGFQKLFQDPQFKPDMIKVYPCLVIEGTALYGMYMKDLYKPYDESTTINLLAEVKKIVPKWVRIMRIQREIPAHAIVAGVKSSNVRQMILDEVERRGFKCQCIRCREIGLGDANSINSDNLKIFREDYESSDGKEIFLSYEDSSRNHIIGFLRLRLPSDDSNRSEIVKGKTSIVRELRVYGSVVPVGLKNKEKWQHQGYGSKLMAESELIAKEEFDLSKMLVISALGTRGYYRKFGYTLDGPYMAKNL